MKDNILTGTMTDVETGETHDIEPSYWFSNGCEINAIVKILEVRSSRFNPDGSPPGQINVDCLALDCLGKIFKLDLYFLPQCLDDQQKITSEITERKILVVQGRYCVHPKAEFIITVYDPKFFPLPTEHSLEEVEEVFRFNSATMVKDIVKTAEQGDIDRQIELGCMYDQGKGVPQDYSEAAKWFRMAAEQGDAKAQFNIGFMYADGRGVSQDYSEAIKWYRMAVEQGDARAQINLGYMYGEGKGVQQDFAEALKWYRKAAERGDATALYNIGDMYKEGRGVPQDYPEAIKWFRKAAEQGDVDAQLELDKMKDK